MAQINAISTLVIMDQMKKADPAIDQFFHNLHLDIEEIKRTKKISSDKALQVWERAFSLLKDPLCHLKVHQYIPYGAYHALELACLSSRTVGDAIQIIVRYFNVINPDASFELQESSDHFVVELKMAPGFRYAAFYLELVIFGIVIRFQNPILQVGKIRLVEFSHSPLDREELYEALFGTKVVFNRTRNALTIPTETWNSYVPFSNTDLLQSLEDYLVEERKKTLIGSDNTALQSKLSELGIEKGDEDDLISKVQRFVVLEIANSDLKVNDAAHFLGMSVRSLQRYLQDQKTSFSEILDSTRETLAKKYLVDEALSIAEVGFLLGFSEQSTFQRAFKRWTGTSPLLYRKNKKSPR